MAGRVTKSAERGQSPKAEMGLRTAVIHFGFRPSFGLQTSFGRARSVKPCLSAWLLLFGLLLLAPVTAATKSDVSVPQVVPVSKRTQVLVAPADLPGRNYVAFPVLLRLSNTALLIGYKRGYSHAQDREADFELRHFNPVTERVAPDKITLHKPNLILQNGELVPFLNGDLACYLDAQIPGQGRALRRGLIEFRSVDGGRTFEERGKLGVIDGVEYGYAFEAVTAGETTFMLVMTFTNLTRGRSVYAGQPAAGAVNVVRTTDYGRTWHFVRDLTREFGNIPINESSFVRHGSGFVVTTRGYNNHHWLQLTDGNFRLKRQIDLTAEYADVRSYIGRPRLFRRGGGFYLLGRNWTAPTNGQTRSQRQSRGEPMKLSLFRFDPDTLALTRHVILDNADGKDVVDGYYAVPYWQAQGNKTLFNVITYRRLANRDPEIVRLEFDWGEVQ